MSQRFDFAKWFGRSIAFVLILAPMIISQFSMDRGAIEAAIKNEDFAEKPLKVKAVLRASCNQLHLLQIAVLHFG